MTNKEISERLRHIAEYNLHSSTIKAFADELDPPHPETGTVVWWQDDEGLGDPVLGQFNDLGRIELFGTTQMINPDSVKYWPAHVLAPGEVSVTIPPVREWLVDAVDMTLSWNRRVRNGKVPVPIPYKTIITREETERMEANQ